MAKSYTTHLICLQIAVDKIGKQVEKNTDREPCCGWDKKGNYIKRKGRHTVEWMEPDRTTGRVIYLPGKQVVYIDKVCRKIDKKYPFLT